MTETDKPDQAQPDEHKLAPPKFKLPPNCRDVTAEHIGEVIAMIGRGAHCVRSEGRQSERES